MLSAVSVAACHFPRVDCAEIFASLLHGAGCCAEEAFLQQQPLPLRLLRWTCADECDYTCMWQAVDAFQKDHSNIPQFYGKVREPRVKTQPLQCKIK